MAKHEDDLLARELGKIGAAAGELGSKIAGTSEFAGSRGGSSGVKFAAQFLPTERHQIELKLRAEPSRLLAKLYSSFERNGRVASDDEAGESPYPKISGVVGSGFLNLNPAVVHAEITAVGDETCTLLLTTAAKEGLIKQHTVGKAVKKIAESIRALE